MKTKILYSVIIGVLACSCSSDPYGEDDVIVYFCDAENVTQDGERLYFKTSNAEFSGGGAQSDEAAYEGKYSIKLDENHKYGMSLKLTDVQVGEYFEISVMEKSNSKKVSLTAGVSGRSNYQLHTYADKNKKNPEDWTRHYLSFAVDTPIDEMTIYTFANGDVAYFDNLEVKRFKKRPPLDVESRISLNIFIPKVGFDSLQSYKEQIVKETIIRDEFKEYVDAYLLSNKDSLPIEMRIKGDWTDHIISGKTSYRIKTHKSHAFENLRSFSIQHPSTRNFMHEWFAHLLCDREDLLSTKYDFLPVTINEISQGIYALEEHFDKQLLEARNYREGPILKLDEGGFWEKALLQYELDTNFEYPFYEASYVSCFKTNRTTKSSTLYPQFINGGILLDLFKNYYKHPEEIFDMEDLARYYALMDLVNVHHSLAWHNRRFYYNPVSAELEHVGFDMLPAIMPFNDLLFYREIFTSNHPIKAENSLDRFIFLNSEFRTYYTEYLKEFSSVAYLDSTFNDLDEDIIYYEELIGAEVPDYKMEREFYYQKAEVIRSQLDSLDEVWDKFELKYGNQNVKIEPVEYADLTTPFILKDISINAYKKKIDSAHYVAQLENFHPNDVKIIGFSIKSNKDSIIPLDTAVTLSGFKNNYSKPDFREFDLSFKPRNVFFIPSNDPNQVYKKKFLKWEKPQGVHPRIELLHKFRTNSKFYTTGANSIQFKSGTIDELIFIPQDYEVVFPEGCEIDFINGGGIIANNNVIFDGSEERPIRFTSSDTSSQGITILKADSVSVKYVEIDGLSALDYSGWTLTGALTVYESSVLIDHLKISNNDCEDALNLIRCDFEISNIDISNTKSDAFDADFCTGRFSSSKFSNTGNDCIDFSGSIVEIKDIEIINSGDKGVSAGERSNLTLYNISVNGALTGVASKDGSTVTGKEISIKNADVGLAAFQKKPEYGPGSIELDVVSYENLIWPAWLELRSHAIVNGKSYWGVVRFDIDAMYARFEK